MAPHTNNATSFKPPYPRERPRCRDEEEEEEEEEDDDDAVGIALFFPLWARVALPPHRAPPLLALARVPCFLLTSFSRCASGTS